MKKYVPKFKPYNRKNKPMIKTIPFDIDLARNGAKVCLTDGREVTIVNFNLKASPAYPILGRYVYGDLEVYEVWPRSGSYTDELGRDGVPQDLRLVDETPEPRPCGKEIFEARIKDLQEALEITRQDRDERKKEYHELSKRAADELSVKAKRIYDLEAQLKTAEQVPQQKKGYYKDIEDEFVVYRDGSLRDQIHEQALKHCRALEALLKKL